MNRSTIYEYLRKDTDLMMRFHKVGKGNYPVLIPPYDWDNVFLLINSTRITNFEALILYSKELVVRFSQFDDWQINIPYKDIEYINVKKDLHIGYMGLYDNEKVYR
jgi:hypothetical protein